MEKSPSVILERPGKLSVREIPIPIIPGDIEYVDMRAVGICGSDVRYYLGENPWALHTLGRNVPSPPNMVLGHEVAGVATRDGRAVPVAILAYKACGHCRYCLAGDENLCSDMEHFGHSAGWREMEYFPGGMANRFTIWKDFAYELPGTIGLEEATFLDGLAVALHALDQGGISDGKRVASIGLGPIGMLASLAAKASGASFVTGCDTAPFPVELARTSGIEDAMQGGPADLSRRLGDGSTVDIVIDTVGTAESIEYGLRMLEKKGRLVLLAVHEDDVPVRGTRLSGERSIVTSSNSRYPDFPRAIELLASRAFDVSPLVTHRFCLKDIQRAFDLLLNKQNERVFKVVIVP